MFILEENQVQLLMGLGPGTKDPEEADNRERHGVLTELTCGHGEHRQVTQGQPCSWAPPWTFRTGGDFKDHLI